MTRSRYLFAGVILFCCSCGEPPSIQKPMGAVEISVKRNVLNSSGETCFRVDFQVNKENMVDAGLIGNMDKNLARCLSIAMSGDTIPAINTQRVNYGLKDRLVYLVYFDLNNKPIAKETKLIYADHFFGLKQKEFIVERN